MSQYYAFYSPKHAVKAGSVFYRGMSGEKIEATFVTIDPQGMNYKWKDKRMVGIVEKFVAFGQVGKRK